VPLTLRPIAHCEIGLVRKTNQDSGYVSDSALIVADGMGGAAAGDLASALAIRELRHVDDAPVEGDEALSVLERYTFQANDGIANLIEINPTLDGMGTTICGGIFDGQNMNIVHIGDSRGYLLSDGVVTRLTHDHSYVQSLVDDGRLRESEAMNHPHRSLLLKVLNGQPGITPDFFATPLKDKDRVMFCSDGLCGLVDDSVISTVLALPNPAEAMSTLVELAHVAGGTDNITIIMADVVEVAGRESGPGAPPDPDPRPATPTEETIILLNPVQPTDYVTSGLIGAAADPQITAMLDELEHEQPPAPGKPLAVKLTSAQQERQRYTPTTKKSHKGFLIIIAAIVVLLGGAGWAVYSYVSSQFFVGESGGVVVIYQGLPGTIAGIDTSTVYETTNIALTDLPTSWRDKVEATIPTSGLDQAHASVQEILAKSLQCVTERNARDPGSPPPADGC